MMKDDILVNYLESECGCAGAGRLLVVTHMLEMLLPMKGPTAVLYCTVLCSRLGRGAGDTPRAPGCQPGVSSS